MLSQTVGSDGSHALKKGVLWYSFSDQSGCVFFHPFSGETLSVKLSEIVLTELLLLPNPFNISEEHKIVIESLISKGFIDLWAGDK